MWHIAAFVATVAGLVVLLVLTLNGTIFPSQTTTVYAQARNLAQLPADREPARTLARGGSCGVELWSIKTMTDSQAQQVNLVPAPTTITAMNALPVPASSTRSGFTLRAWTVTATLTGYKLEADSDYHLVLADNGKTAIAEIPSPACAQGSRVLVQITQARAAFEAVHPQAAECFNCLHQTVTVTGIGFFDRPHGQNGVADNAVELHPVIGFGQGGPAPPPPTPTTTITPQPQPQPQPSSCKRYPHRHWYHGIYHKECRSYYYTTP